MTEGTTVTASDGTEFSISYKADGGKEVVLTQITPTPQAPTFTSVDSTTFTVGSAGSFTVTASGYPPPTLGVNSSDTLVLPSGVAFNTATGVLSGTPAAGSSGTYTLNFTATNSLGSVSQIFTLTVNQAPAITSSNSVAFAIGYDGDFVVTTTGSPKPTLKESGPLPSGVSFTDNRDGTTTLAGTPATGTTGRYHFSITASNGVGSDFTQSFTLTVSQPQAPVITSVSSAAFTIGHDGNFTVTATGYPTPTLTESGALPSGATFTDHGNGTATLSGTPATGTKGTYQIDITAENSLGSAYTQGFMLTINLAPPPPPPPPVLSWGSMSPSCSGNLTNEEEYSGEDRNAVVARSADVRKPGHNAGGGKRFPAQTWKTTRIGARTQRRRWRGIFLASLLGMAHNAFGRRRRQETERQSQSSYASLPFIRHDTRQ